MIPVKSTAMVAACVFVSAMLGGCSSSSSNAPKVAAGCTPAHAGIETVAAGKLTVSVYVSPPYSEETGGSFGGVDPTIVKRLAQMECLSLDIKSVAGAALIAGVQAKRADLGVGGIYYTADRAQSLGLSVPMYQDGMALLSTAALSGNLDDLRGKSVGVIQGASWDSDLQHSLGSGKVKVYQATDGMITDLRNGRLVAAVVNSAEAGYRAKQTSGLTATQVQSYPGVAASQSKSSVVLAITKAETGLQQALDADIAVLLSDGTVKSALSANGMDPSLAGGTTK